MENFLKHFHFLDFHNILKMDQRKLETKFVIDQS